MKNLILIGLLIVSITSNAKIKVKAHFKMAKGSAVTYAISPPTIESITENYKLTRHGKPLFFALAPEKKTGGSVLFKDNNGYYQTEESIVNTNKNFILEAWVLAKKEANEDSHGLKLFGAVSAGDGSRGYSIAQQNNKWVLLVGGAGTYKFGDVCQDKWTHLAMVVNGEESSLWVDGIKTGSFHKTNKINKSFTIGKVSNEQSIFNGMIYEVRYSEIEAQDFDSRKDLLINYKFIKEKSKLKLQNSIQLINKIESKIAPENKVKNYKSRITQKDFLISKINLKSKLYFEKINSHSAKLILNNGIIERSFYINENIACTSYKNLTNNSEYIRAIKPESRVKVDGRWIEIGGLKGQPEKSYIMESWLKDMKSSESALKLTDITIEPTVKRYHWKQKFNATKTEWPPKGIHLIFHFGSNTIKNFKNLDLKVHYEIYDGIPVMAKWITIINNSEQKIKLNENECEILAINQDQIKKIHIESNFSCGLINSNPVGSALLHFAGKPDPYHAGRSTTKWSQDPEYNTWATHNPAEDNFLEFPHINLLKSTLPVGPSTNIEPGENYKSFTTFEILFDGDNKERNTLSHRRMYKKLAPQVTENLLCAGITSNDEQKLKNFIDQMAEIGFERLDVMAWPGIKHDNLDPDYVKLWKNVADYASKSEIVVGGYELQIASRSRGAKYNCVDLKTGKPGSVFGQSVCIASEWKDEYFPKMWDFFDKTGLMTYNMDGPYHGDPCGSKIHKHHINADDSQWEQWKVQVDILDQLQKRNMYVPIPDWYFLNGQSTTGMGYREASANLSPQQQLLLGRQYIYDGTWHKIPPMGWMSMQLVGFYTNDPKVGLEPLSENLDRYEKGLIQYLGSGCQFTLRGNRLYDTPKTKKMLKKWIDWFKTYRKILTSEIIHIGRPNGRDLDCLFHVNPFIEDKGMAVIFNPTDKDITKKFKLPLYYTGINKQAEISIEGSKTKLCKLNNKNEIEFSVTIKAGKSTWVLVKNGSGADKL